MISTNEDKMLGVIFVVSLLITLCLGIIVGVFWSYTAMKDKYIQQEKVLEKNKEVFAQIDDRILKSKIDCEDDLKKYWREKNKEFLNGFKF